MIKGYDRAPAVVYRVGERPVRCYHAMRVPDAGLKAVVYVGLVLPNGGFQVKGTGFLVSQPLHGKRAEYLVTADHVVESLGTGRFGVRINDSAGVGRVLWDPKKKPWWKHPSEKIDAAVVPFIASDRYPYKLVPTERFVTNENLERTMIGVGDQVFVIGLFRLFGGQTRVIPLVRIGHVAMMAGEPLPTANYGPMYGHLIEAFSLKGLSGSPVFAFETVSTPIQDPQDGDPPYLDGVGNWYLLGLMHGYMKVPLGSELGRAQADQVWHSGISIVVPSTKILEILNQPDLIEYQRERMMKSTEGPPIQETAISEEPAKPSARKGTGKNRDIPIPDVANRAKFFDDLGKATRKLDKP